jgi:4-amino-4-deoxy-L-arabinose transferase-like glycosyltransferase
MERAGVLDADAAARDATRTRAGPLAWLVALVAVAAALSARDLWSPDEPRYGRVAQEMVGTGEWLVPHLNGEPYAEKPPLAFWTMAAIGKVTGGVTAAGARLACALYAAIAVLTTARLARRWFRDAALGDTAAAIFGTCYLVLWNGPRAGLDLPMTACTLLAVEGATVLIARGSALGAVGFGAALGAGMLAKGPHALFVPICASVGGGLGAKAGRRLLDPRWLLGLAVTAAVFLAWYVPAVTHGGAAYYDRLVGQIGSRLKGEEAHEHGPFYLWPLLLALTLPWTPHWILGLAETWRRRKDASPELAAERFGLFAAAAAILVPMVLLSVPPPKRDVYLVPLLPHAAILGAWAVHRGVLPALSALAVRGTAVLCTVIGVGAFALPFAAPAAWKSDAGDRISGETLAHGDAVVGLVAFGALCVAGGVAAFAMRRRPVASTRVVAVALAGAWVVAAAAILPAFDPGKSLREPAAVAREKVPGAALYYGGFQDPWLLWAFDPTGRRTATEVLGVETKEQAKAWNGRATALSVRRMSKILAPDAPPAVLFTKSKHWDEALKEADRMGPEARRALDAAEPLWQGRIGDAQYSLHGRAPRP